MRFYPPPGDMPYHADIFFQAGPAKHNLRTVNDGGTCPFPFTPEQIAHAYYPKVKYAGEIHLHSAYTFSDSPSASEYDLQSTLVHELGHTLGLGHSPDKNSVMYAYQDAGAIMRRLGQDDINGVRALYGPHR